MSSVDSMLSFEGQRLLASLVRVPAGTNVNSPLNDFSYMLTEPPTGARREVRVVKALRWLVHPQVAPTGFALLSSQDRTQ